MAMGGGLDCCAGWGRFPRKSLNEREAAKLSGGRVDPKLPTMFRPVGRPAPEFSVCWPIDCEPSPPEISTPHCPAVLASSNPNTQLEDPVRIVNRSRCAGIQCDRQRTTSSGFVMPNSEPNMDRRHENESFCDGSIDDGRTTA